MKIVKSFSSQVKRETLEIKSNATKFEFTRFEIPIAQYAVTMMIKKLSSALLVDPTSSFLNPPSSTTIKTNYNEKTVVFNDVQAYFPQGILSAIYFYSSGVYRVEIGGTSKKNLNFLADEFSTSLRKANFYQGKCLKIAPDGMQFISPPAVSFRDVVLPEAVMKGYKMNTVDFLCDPKMQKITKKRGIILHGPPGVGKTTLIEATFSALSKEKITSVFVAGDSFRRFSMDQAFNFVTKYLTPCMLVMEDFDLIAPHRDGNASRFIGEVLSWLNGIEEIDKPIVVVGTTNRFDILDKAATRPCRFDRHYEIKVPDKNLVKKLWKSMLPGVPVNGVMKHIGEVTGAHIREIANTAKMIHERTKKPMNEAAELAVKEVSESFLLLTQKGVVGFNTHEDGKSPQVSTEIERSENLREIMEKREGGVQREACEGGG